MASGSDPQLGRQMSGKKSDNVVWQNGAVETGDRRRLMGQKEGVFWFTGLSGSGKSALARGCEKKLIGSGRPAFVLDGDNLRHGLSGDLGFSPEDRSENIRRAAEVAALMADAGLIVLTAFISPYMRDREQARRIIGPGRFFEIYLDVPLSVCEARDPKNLYKRARTGEIPDFTGISAPYEPPPDPDLAINTALDRADRCIDAVMNYITEKTQR